MIENCNKQEKLLVLEYLKERFGIEADLFSNYEFYSGGQGRVYLAPSGISNIQKIVTVGLSVARTSSTVKPTTNFFQSFGSFVKKNIVLPSKEKTLKYLKGEDFQLDELEMNSSTEGYVMIQYKSGNNTFFLGCGLFQNNWIKNVLPKEKRLDIKFI
ncbi:hypothetical protein HY988_05880 [Candidatus Micrarchaeota archaeon]|nr:hypothetical protein [Candidatus Micrarchaeota archaeon]